MIDFIPMKLEPDMDPVPLEIGQIVMVEFEGMSCYLGIV